MSDFQTIRIDRDDRGVATLWLARADKHNALSAQMRCVTFAARTRGSVSVRTIPTGRAWRRCWRNETDRSWFANLRLRPFACSTASLPR